MNRDDVDYLFSFIGYGDPNSRLWFVGSEEGGEPEMTPKRVSHKSLQQPHAAYDPVLPSGSNAVWIKCREIAENCGVRHHYFLSNMGPLARKSEASPHRGLDERNYVRRVVSERIPLLRQAAKHAIVVFHGKAAWRRYQVQTGFNLGVPMQLSNGRVLAFRQRQVLVASTLSWGRRHFTDRDQGAVERQLREWLDG